MRYHTALHRYVHNSVRRDDMHHRAPHHTTCSAMSCAHSLSSRVSHHCIRAVRCSYESVVLRCLASCAVRCSVLFGLVSHCCAQRCGVVMSHIVGCVWWCLMNCGAVWSLISVHHRIPSSSHVWCLTSSRRIRVRCSPVWCCRCEFIACAAAVGIVCRCGSCRLISTQCNFMSHFVSCHM